MKHSISTAKRIVIKVGSALLVDSNGVLHQQWLQAFLDDIARCFARGQEIIIVSSGAIALGRKTLAKRPTRLEENQAAAAIGQIQLAQAYQNILSEHQIPIAQLLLTLGDSESRVRYLNARNTLETLLQHKVIPIINENDTVATTEIRYGDNDRLAARVAQMVDADVLVLFSDVDGLYTADPRKDSAATLIPEVTEITPELMMMADSTSTVYGTGGMRTKLAAANIVMSTGAKMVIGKGVALKPLQALEQGANCTWFLPKITPKQARKNWLENHLDLAGTIVIDHGAEKALVQGSSLLAVGMVQVNGDFGKGACVKISNHQGLVIAHGLSNYSATDARKIIGQHSSKITEILGYQSSDEIIHRNDLALIQRSNA